LKCLFSGKISRNKIVLEHFKFFIGLTPDLVGRFCMGTKEEGGGKVRKI
jgi:hypothetical protein